jgi:hypothetical protein
MGPEEKQLLQRVANQVSENNAILRGIRSSQRRATAFRALYWVLIVVLSVVAYVAIQPYLNMLSGVSSGNLDKVLNQYTGQ